MAIKCYVLMTKDNYDKMSRGEDYDSLAATYSKTISGAKNTFRNGQFSGSCVIVGPNKAEDIIL